MKTYAIKWTIDDTQAQAAFRRGQRSVEAVEAAMARAGSGAEVVLNKRVQREEAAARQSANTRISEEQRVARELEKINDRWNVRMHQQAARQRSFELGPNGRLGQRARVGLSSEILDQAAMNRAFDVIHKRQVDMRLEQMGLNDSFAEGIAQGLGLSNAATKAGIALMGVAAAKAGIEGVARALFDARKNSEDMATGMLEFMVKLRPLASVMGQKPTRGFAEQVAGFGVRTGMEKEQAASFLESFYGAANLFISNIGQKEFEKFTEGAARLATARGIEGPQAAELGAAVLQVENFAAKGQGAKEALTRMNALFSILDAGKGLINKLAPQATQLISTFASENELEGLFRTTAEAGMVTSLMATAHPEDPAVFARAGIKALSRFGDKKRQPFYRRAGIVPGMPAVERFQRANQVFEEEIAKGKPIERVLSEFHLDTDVREQQALAAAFGTRHTVFAKQMERMRQFERPEAVGETEAMISQRFAEEDVKFTAGKAGVEKARLKAESIPLKLAKQQAEAELIKEGMDTTFLGMLGQSLGTMMSLGQRPGREAMIETRALRNLRIQAGENPAVTGAEAFFGNKAAEIERLTKAIEENTKAQRATAGNNNQPPALMLPVGMNAAPLRP